MLRLKHKAIDIAIVMAENGVKDRILFFYDCR